MTREQHQTQDAQNAQQSEYPASAGSGYKESQPSASADATQVDQVGDSPGSSQDAEGERSGGTTRSSEEEPGRSQQDGKTRGSGEETAPTSGQGVDSRGI